MKFEIRLVPHGIVKPVITYGLDTVINTIRLDEPVTLTYDGELDAGAHTFFFEFENKTNSTLDMAVEIDRITIEGITVDRFKWAGLYYPVYPEPWASQQTEVLPQVRESATYLGWNGRWELTFALPIFTWIHELEHLGWIYT